jgi:thiol-disulfide isomerase/thioredoxin
MRKGAGRVVTWLPYGPCLGHDDDMKETLAVQPEAARPAATSSRRSALLGGVGVLAALGGAALAWWRLQPHEVGSRTLGDGGALWAQTFPTPGGGELVMESLRGKPLLINFWATWCPPCVEELPLLDRFYRENLANGWQVVGLAIDKPDAVLAFLEKMPLSFPVALAGLGGTELAKSLGNLVGGLPFTVVLGSQGMVLHRKMGQVSGADLTLWRSLK